MPTVEMSDGTWLQDSSVIIDHFAKKNRAYSITPPGASQQLASALLEVFADEWMPMAALHFRWNNPENAEFALNEFARLGFPWLPRFVGRKLVRPLARRMRSYLPILGVCDNTAPAVEETAMIVIASLEKGLKQTRFILGNRPCLGDFSLYGPLYAHLYRDPGSRWLFDEAPRVVQWMECLRDGANASGNFLENDVVPSALDPVFDCILTDQWAWLRTLVHRINAYCLNNPDAQRVPRALGEAEFSIRGQVGRRKLATFPQWKAQRAYAVYEASNGAADLWLSRVSAVAKRDRIDLLVPISNPFDLDNHQPVLCKPGR